jgi:UDP-N-acetylmuramoyl-tripeptide--D-alanyl-D-alanine ligase
VELRIDEVAAITGGTATGEAVVQGASNHSSEIQPGQLFVPIVAERDGHDFIAAAVEAGAGAYLTSRPPAPEVDVVAVRVSDTAAALTALGRAARDRLPDQVVGVTGSVGKTSVKDLLAAALSTQRRTAASLRSLNNELGVPLTLLNAPDDTEVTVVEMGARGPRHVAELCDIARPTVGVVTAVAMAHTELFGSLAEVARAKGELIESLPTSGTAVLNASDQRVLAMAARTAASVLTYGEEIGDVRVTRLRLDAELRPSFRLVTPWGDADVRLQVRGQHNAENAAGAAAAALACGVEPGEVAEGLAAAELSPWRMDLRRTATGAFVLNDSYNANPASMRTALRALVELPADRRVAVLGLMAELGAAAPDEHATIAALAEDLGVRVIAVDAPLYAGAEHVATVDEARTRLGALGPGDAVLLKGSRVAGLERLAAALLT